MAPLIHRHADISREVSRAAEIAVHLQVVDFAIRGWQKGDIARAGLELLYVCSCGYCLRMSMKKDDRSRVAIVEVERLILPYQILCKVRDTPRLVRIGQVLICEDRSKWVEPVFLCPHLYPCCCRDLLLIIRDSPVVV